MLGKCIVFAVFCYGFSWSLLANLDAADALFMQRSQGEAMSLKAREAYSKLLGSAQGDVKTYVIAQMSRLDLFRSVMLPKVPLEKAKEILEGCVTNIEAIKQTQSQEYFYLKTACLAFRAKLAKDTAERLDFGGQIKDIQQKVLEASTDSNGNLKGGFEGGGCLRVLAGIYSNPKATIFKLFVPRKALEFATAALETDSKLNRPFPNEMTGRDYFENYYYQAFAKIGIAIDEADLNEAKEAVKILKDTMEEIEFLIDSGEIDTNKREGETRYYYRVMGEVRDAASQCIASGDGWLDCLIEELERF